MWLHYFNNAVFELALANYNRIIAYHNPFVNIFFLKDLKIFSLCVIIALLSLIGQLIKRIDEVQ